MNRSSLIPAATLWVAAAAAATFSTRAPAQDIQPQTFDVMQYSGRATVVDARLALLSSRTSIVIADTGELDPWGTPRDATVHQTTNPPPLRLSMRTAYSVAAGAGPVSSATAQVERLRLDVNGGLNIAADEILATAESVCDSATQTVAIRGRARIHRLRVNGVWYPVNPQPNSVLEIPGVVTIVFNERERLDFNTIEIRAMRIIVPGIEGVLGSEIVISRAKAGIITCPPLPAD